MDSVRVLYAAFDVVPSPKGASTHITYFVRGLIQAGYPLQLITVGHPSLPENDTYCGASMWRVPGAEDANFLARAVAFGEAVMSHVEAAPGYAVAHFRSLWCGLPLVRSSARLGYRTLFEVNGLPGIELKYHFPALRASPLLAKIQAQELATLLLADAIICPSAVTREYIASRGVPRDKIQVIPNGVDLDRFRPQPLRAEAPVTTLLYVGTLADWQGLEVLVEALPLVLARRPVRLRIVGRGRGRQLRVLRKLIRRLGVEEAVAIEEAVPHEVVPELIASADVCIAPLAYNDRNVTQGCCPLKIIEYMACGRPVVAADLPVVRELVREGVDALLFTPDDPADLARCILRLVEDHPLAERLAGAAAERARRCYGWEKAVKKLLAVYGGVCRRQGDP